MDKEKLKNLLETAEQMNKYAVIGEPKTYCSYNEGWQDAIDYVSREATGFTECGPGDQEVVYIILYYPESFDAPEIEAYSCEECAEERARQLKVPCFILKRKILFEC